MAPDEIEFHPSSRVEASPPPRFSFSTGRLPERDRGAFFREELAPILALDVELLNDDLPRHSMSLAMVGPVALSSIEVSPTGFYRRRRHLDGCDDFFFNPMTSGWQQMTRNGRAVRFDVGEGCLMHLGQTADCHFPEGGSALGIRIDGAALRALVRRPEEMVGVTISANHPGMALLMGYLRSFSETKDALTPQLRHNFGLHIVDLIASILGTSRDGAAQAEAGGIRAARLRQVLDSIATRAGDPDFGVETVAAELAVSSRTIQLMLEETGSTFSEHVSEHRLRRAWRLLADVGSRLTIAEVAYEAGFNDLSHFYRAFRRRYRETPAAARASGRRLH